MSERNHEKPEVLGINRRNLDLVFADYRPGKFRLLDDKLAAKALLQEHGIAVPRTLGVVREQEELDGLPELLEGLGDFVIKPANGWGGRGILVLGRAERADDGEPRWRRPGGELVDTADIAAHVSDVLSGIYSLDEDRDAAILEERIFPHAFHERIYGDGLSDLRVVIDHGEAIQAMCRLPADASDGKANLNAGGVGLGVDVATGLTTGAICKGREITHHPDSGVELIGLQLPYWHECIDLARRAGSTVDLDYVGIDLVVDRDRGPLVLEMNARPGLGIQLANKEGQRVAPRRGPSRLDRYTFRFAWLLLALMALLPLAFEAWQSRSPDIVWIDAGAIDAVRSPDPDRPAEMVDGDMRVTDEEEAPLSATSGLFGDARAAAAAGDTARARSLYQAALADSALAPFALNNLALMSRDAGRDEEAIAHLEAAIERYPSYSRGHYNLGLMLMDLERVDDAIAAFERALELQPTHAGSWAKLGQARFDRKDYPGAEQALEQAIRFQPDARNARLRLGLTHRLRGDLPRAEARFSELLALNPGSEAGVYWWARTVMEQIRGRQGAEAAVSRDSLLSVLGPHVAEPNLSSRCLSLASCLRWETGDRVGALHGFRKLMDEGYQKSSSRLSAAAVAIELGQWNLADALLRDDVGEADAYAVRLREICLLGEALDERASGTTGTGTIGPASERLARDAFRSADLEIFRLAVTGLRTAARAHFADWAGKESAPSWYRWLLADEGSTDPPPAASDVVDAAAGLDCDPEYFGQRRLSADGIPAALSAWLLLETAVSRGETGTAAALRGLLVDASAPENSEFRPLLVEYLQRFRAEGDLSAARAVALRLLKIHPEDHDVRLIQAEIELSRGRPKAARAQFRLLPSSFRRSTDARVLLGRIHLADGSPARGLRELDRALDQDPDHVEARYARGIALFEQGRDRQAERELLEVLNRAPGRSDVRRTLAEQLMDRRRYAEAADHWNRVLRLDVATDSDRFNLALSLQRNHEYERCLEVWDSLLSGTPENHRAWFNRSLALEKLGRDEEARAGFEQVLTLQPGHEASRRKLGLPSPETMETDR